MFTADYFEDQFPTPYRVLGLGLKPFCLGHYMLLAHPAIDCAFISEKTAVATLADLVVGVLICSKTYEEGRKFLDGNWLEDVRAFGKECGVFDLKEKAKLFSDYIKEGSAMPRYWELSEGEQKKSGGHWTQAVKLCLTGKLHYSADEVMNMPLRQAFTDYFKHAESEGQIQLMTPEEVASCEEDERQEAACQP